jgi:hypothetical protein
MVIQFNREPDLLGKIKQLVVATLLVGFLFVASQAWASVPVVKVSAKPVRNSSGAFQWQLTTLPSDADILTVDPILRPQLLRNLAFIRAHDGHGAYNALRQFQNTLARGISRFEWDVPPDPKSAQDQLLPVLSATFPPAPPPQAAQLKIEVKVEGSDQITKNPVSTTIGAMQAHGVNGLPALTPEDQRTVVTVSGPDGVGANPMSWNASPEHAIACDAAVAAFVSAKTSRLKDQDPQALGSQPGLPPLPSEAVRSAVATYINRTFTLLGTWQPIPGNLELGARYDRSSRTWVVSVPLLAVGNVTFQIIGLKANKDLTWKEFTETNWYAADPAAFEADKKKVEAQMTASLQGVFDELQHTLVDETQFALHKGRIETIVRQKSATEPPVVVNPSGTSDLVVQAVRVPTVTTFSIGGGYSNDKHLFGSLTGSIAKNGMSGSLSAEAGEKKQDGTLSYSLPGYFNSDDRRWSAGLDITGNFTHATDLQLNQPNSPGTDTDNVTAEVANTLKFTSLDGTAAEAAASKGLYQAALETAAGYSDVSWNQHGATASPLQSGGVLYLRLGLNQEWLRTFSQADKPGPGSLDLLLALHVKEGIDAGPGKFGFTSLGGSLTTTFYFGPVTPTDYFLRAIVGGGAMVGTAPVSEEFELGGNNIMRGLDQDERTARGLAWQSLEAGVSLETLLRLLPAAVAALQPTADQQTLQMQNPLKSIYLTGFSEFAEITQTSVNQIQHLPSSLQSYGSALELHWTTPNLTGSGKSGTTQLRLGYAWSPESTHSHGMFFTDVSIPIF